MLDTAVSNLLSETQAGVQLRDKRFKAAAKIVKQYHTATYDGGPPLDDPENHAFEYITLVAPQMIFENPVCHVSGDETNLLETALNRTLYLNDMRSRGLEIAIDQCFCWGVARIDPTPMQGDVPGLVNSDGSFDAVMPTFVRVPQGRFVMDPLALHKTDARWNAQQIVRDRDDLLAEAKRGGGGWIVEAIAGLQPSSQTKLRPNKMDVTGVDRKEIDYWEMWMPEIDLDESPGPAEGFHGTIFTFAETGSGGGLEIRKPRPYYGPPGGPFVLFGTHLVPDELWPLSALYPVQAQVVDLNAHGIRLREAAGRHKRIGLGDAIASADSQRIKDAVDGDFLLVTGLDKTKVVDIELAGASEAMFVYRNFARELLDRTSGISDAMRGNATGDATATENVIADNAGSIRIAFVKRQFQAGMREACEKLAWFLHNDVRSTVTGPGQSVYLGGSGRELAERLSRFFPGVSVPPEMLMQKPTPLTAMDVRLEPASMDRMDTAVLQRNAVQKLDIATKLIPLMAQFPDGANYGELLEDFGQAFGDPDYAKQFNPEGAAKNMMALAQLGQAGEATPEAGGVQPSQGAQPPEQPAVRKQDGLRMQRRIQRSGENPQVRGTVATARSK